ncbi:MAG: response regulator [Chloroflexi bacterium]|nr:MAG: response regulator [Chloroflexota bacterium]
MPPVKQDSTVSPGSSDDRLAFIAAATDAFSDAVPDIESLLGLVAEHISRATGDFCAVVLLSPDGRQLEPVTAFHPDPQIMEDARPLLGVAVDLDKAGVWQKVLGERRPVIIPIDPDHLPPTLAPHQVRHMRRWRVRESAMIPMIAQDTVVGGLNLNRMEGSAPFSPDDMEHLASLASRAARAIATAQMLRSQRLLADKLEAMVAERTEALRAAQHEAEHANLAKSQFLARMSHELRTPLNAILGFSELLIDDGTGRIDDVTRKRFMNQIHSSGRHLLDLINDILDLSKVEAGQMELQLERINVATAFSDVLATVDPLAGQKAITLTAHADQDIHVVVDASKLRQMLLNLLSNAIKFTPAGGRVTVRAERAGAWIDIVVSDTGVGIASPDLSRLFIEFQQLGRRPYGPIEGTGLGLALTRRLAQAHGGDVSVSSVEGAGSTFTIRLPAEPVARTEADPPLVLVVDDNAAAAELLVRHLESGGFRMAIARNGTEALRMARELKPAAITLDILLPEIDGWEVLSRLKEDETTRNIPVVVISVVDDPAVGRALGAVDYFVKPVDGKALLSRLDQYTLVSKLKREEVRVLVVDDEPANLDLLESQLKPAGFDVVRAEGGQAGIDMARSQAPNLILLDLMMPGVSGFQVVEALRAEEKTRSIPIMVLTAKVLTAGDKRALNGQVSGIFERDSVAGPELIGWLKGIVGKTGQPA